MVHQLIYSLVAVSIISLISFIGIFTLSLNKKILNKILTFIVAFSAGSLLATAFFDLIPESLNVLENLNFVFLGLLLFFFIEAFIHWHHHHIEYCIDCIQPVAYLNLIGDSIHNFLDGIIIVASFLINISTGISTTIAIALHEIPQEIGDFGVLLHSGYNKKKALWANFFTALTAVLGGIIGYFISSYATNFISYLLPFAAGGFIYIAMSDLMPEIRKETSLKKSLLSFSFFVLGVVIMYVAKFLGE